MVDIVIVNWNSGAYLQQCINSITNSSAIDRVNRIIIIDNNSADTSCSSLVAHPKILVQVNQQNNGFAKACNQGFKLCTAAFVLLLNPDTLLFDDTLPACITYLQQHTGTDILGCRLVQDDGTTAASCSRFPTPLRIFYDAAGLSKIAPRLFTPATVMTDWKHDSSRFVNQVMGAFMFMRLEIFKQYGYFDERFFVYYEELDFSKRLADAGGKTFYNNSIKAVHAGEGTTQAVKAFRLSLNLNSRLLYAQKHFSKGEYLLVWAATFFIEPVSRIIFALLKGRPADAGQVIAGFKLLLKHRAKQI
ncbi:MAG: hypothetical protein RL172_3356 [Bacteroidota bacterium]|jgi:N-acetylglucosaminyl-diphospho-decaprenol L-rhamnosyltransferase